MNLSIDVFLIIFLGTVLIAAAVNDLRFQRIPNQLTYPSMGIALVYHFIMNGIDGLLFSAGGLALGIAVFIIPFLMRTKTNFPIQHLRISYRALTF